MDHELKENYLSQNPRSPGKLRILVAPLDWGLGHATRCIPVIYELKNKNCEVWIAAEGHGEALLRREFPEARFINLKGYRVRYAATSFATRWKLLLQSGRILRTIDKEHEWLLDCVNKYSFDGIISDNRYGLYHPELPSVLITHQLNIKTGFGKWIERYLRQRVYKFVEKFNACWIPDQEGDINLAGELSHPLQKPSLPLHYIGLLSRFPSQSFQPTTIRKDHLLVLLSGPEPQRSIFENIIIKQIAHYSSSATVIRGLPNERNIIPSTNSLQFINHLPAKELESEIAAAEFVICRSGYSSLMDLMRMQKKAIVVPTPGQTEQEYLAGYMKRKELAFCTRQAEFSLGRAISAATTFPYKYWPSKNDSLLAQAVDEFLDAARKRHL